MIRGILPANDPRLRYISKPVKNVDKKTLSLINDLKDTLKVQKDPEGVGLAAPQIGKNVRVFVAKTPKGVMVIINPKVLYVSKDPVKKPPAQTSGSENLLVRRKASGPRGKKKTGKTRPDSHKAGLAARQVMEGCLSLINYYGPLRRPEKIKLSYLSEEGKEKIQTFTGFTAQIIQHEIDHLQGILFIDRLIEQKKPLYELAAGEWEKVELA